MSDYLERDDYDGAVNGLESLDLDWEGLDLDVLSSILDGGREVRGTMPTVNSGFHFLPEVPRNGGLDADRGLDADGGLDAATAANLDLDEFAGLAKSILDKFANSKQISSSVVAKAIKVASGLANTDVYYKEQLLLTVVDLWQKTKGRKELFDGSNARQSAVLGYFLLNIVTTTGGRRSVQEPPAEADFDMDAFNMTFYSFVQFCTVYLLLRYGLQWHRSGMDTQDKKFKNTFRKLLGCISVDDYSAIVSTLNMFNFKPPSRFHQAVVSFIVKFKKGQLSTTELGELGRKLCTDSDDGHGRLTTVCLEHKKLRRHTVRDRSGKKNRDSWYPLDHAIPPLLQNHLPQKSRRHPDVMKDRFAALWYRKM